VFVIVDDYSGFTWTLFLGSKDETFKKFLVFLKRTEKRVEHSLVCLKFDHGKEFETSTFFTIVMNMVLIIISSAPRTPQQNGGRA